ncbi:BglC protein [Escherichia coli]|uniref:BglC protein n=1 Tax=Escherichia coli TaxID=562 RepID=Q47079_ECOLX|nr:ORF 19 [Escherichia coli]CAI4146153.1 BglC protein [Escherichia coli]CAI6160635.1 BglC protein [Escherichia coli]CAI6167047.1 BglC protein [Escherichia coli]CAI6185128.1 BglC protein [Escherichia coli]
MTGLLLHSQAKPDITREYW